MKKYTGLFVGLGILLVIVLWLVGAYNGFINLGEDTNTAWAQVENQYQRRFDLIPNLVETVKGIATHEQAVFLGVAEARAKVGQMSIDSEMLSDPDAFAAFQGAQGELSGALSRLLVSVEAYPEVKANENFLALQGQLEGTENRISTERMRYNDSAKIYNKKAKAIPGVFLVSIFGLDKEKQLFDATAGAETAPVVNFQ